VGGDLEEAAFEAGGLFGLGAGALVGEVGGALGTEAGALGEEDDRAQSQNEDEAAAEEGVLLAAAGELGGFGLLVETEEIDFAFAALGLVAGIELDHTLAALLVEQCLAIGGVAALVLQGGAEFAAGLVGAGELAVNTGEHGGAFEGLGDSEGGVEFGDGLVEAAKTPQGGGDATVAVGDAAGLVDGLVSGESAAEGVEGGGRVAGGEVNGAEIGDGIGRADAVFDRLTEGEGAEVEGAGGGVVALTEKVVGGAVEHVGDAVAVAPRFGDAQGLGEMARGGGELAGFRVAETEGVVGGGEEIGVGDFFGEAEGLLECLDGCGQIADAPIGAPEHEEESGLGGGIAGLFGVGGAGAGEGEGGGIIAPVAGAVELGEAGGKSAGGRSRAEADLVGIERLLDRLEIGAEQGAGAEGEQKGEGQGAAGHGLGGSVDKKDGVANFAVAWRRDTLTDGFAVGGRKHSSFGTMKTAGLFFAAILIIGGSGAGNAAPMAVQVAEGRRGMVAAGHPDATAAGLAVLQAGGNAVDAAVAVSFALGVTEPYGSGTGGKLSLVYREAKTGRVMVIEAMDEASRHLVPAEFRALTTEQRRVGVQSVAVPGQVAGILEAHRRWGTRPRAELLAPAIKLADAGFEVRSAQVKFFRAQEAKLKANAELGRIYLPGGEMPSAGERLRNPDLARTLRLVAEKGADGFYKGPVAEAMVKALREAGSPLQADDFAGYEARLAEPLRVKFQGADVFSVPPPVSGGGVYLLALAAFDSERPKEGAVLTPETLDRLMKVYLEVDTACREVLGDRPASRESWQKLLGAERVAALRKQALKPVAEAATTAALGRGEADEQADGFEAMAAETTHFVVIDQAGNVVSATQSQSNHFGSGIVPPGTGVVLNNSLSNFNRISGNPNEVGAGKRPRSTITPAVIVRDGKLVAALGLPGGSRIPSAMVQVTVDYLLYGRSLEDAIGAPRFHAVTRKGGDPTNRFETEKETDYRVAEALKAKFGWKDGTDSETESFGGFNAVEVMPDGRLRGYADQRRSNTAMGY